jgi:alpha-L-fucosidase
MNAKHRELIREYDPDILWFDTPNADSDHLRARQLIADFYERAARRGQDVVVNDRAATDAVGPTIDVDEAEDISFHGDFTTPEYATLDSVQPFKWETCRGVGHSFGYNRAEDEGDHIDPGELVRLFVDVVAKNGNLLLNVGPRADGTIPDPQRDRLEALGEWLDACGEAVFGTRPWAVAEDDASEVPVRYTQKDGDCYATALEWPGDELTLSVPAHVDVSSPTVTVLDGDGGRECETSVTGDRLTVSLPECPPHDYAYSLRLDGLAG